MCVLSWSRGQGAGQPGQIQARFGIIDPTEPAHRVRTIVNSDPPDRIPQGVSTGGEGDAVNPQKKPRAALASSDILSGVQGGERVISASTWSTPSTGSSIWRISSSISGPIGQPMVVSV
jgi:hypothetical protein